MLYKYVIASCALITNDFQLFDLLNFNWNTFNFQCYRTMIDKYYYDDHMYFSYLKQLDRGKLDWPVKFTVDQRLIKFGKCLLSLSLSTIAL